jgi:hypothetical protein
MEEKQVNSLRGLSFMFGVMAYLKDDPLCSRCRTFVKSIEVARDKFLVLEKSVNKSRDIPEEMRGLLLSIYTVLADLNIPDDPTGQKKTGSCKLPARVCFPRSALAIYERLSR